MMEKAIKRVICGSSEPYALLNSLLIAAARENTKLTEDEKAERRERRR